MRISDWSSDVCSSDLARLRPETRIIAEPPQQDMRVEQQPHSGQGRSESLPSKASISQSGVTSKSSATRILPFSAPGCRGLRGLGGAPEATGGIAVKLVGISRTPVAGAVTSLTSRTEGQTAQINSL